MHVLATGAEKLISAHGVRPVAADGTLVWSEDKGSLGYPSFELHMMNASELDRVIASGIRAYFPNYEVSGNYVAWSPDNSFFGLPDQNTFFYNIATQQTRKLGYAPVFLRISGDLIATEGEQSPDPHDQASGGGITLYHISSGLSAQFISKNNQGVGLVGFIGDDYLAYILWPGLYLAPFH
jgi:hypothetical protein